MLRFAGCCRFVWNKALALQKARKVHGAQKLGYSALCKELTAWRHAEDTAFLAEAPMHPLQQSLKDLERAYQNFFEKRANVPQFKKKGRHDSFRYPDPQQFKLDEANSRVFLPKLGWVRYCKSRAITGAPKQMTLSREAGKWYISIQTAQEVEPQHSRDRACRDRLWRGAVGLLGEAGTLRVGGASCLAEIPRLQVGEDVNSRQGHTMMPASRMLVSVFLYP